MKLTLAVPVWNQLNDSKGILALLKHNTSPETEMMIIDNGSTDPYEDFCYKYLKPSRLNYIKNDQNIGLVKTYQQAFDACVTDLLAVVHNDVFIYEKDWDQRVIRMFETMPDLGAVGLFGSQGCGPVGERIQDVTYYGQAAGWSNMLEAEVHGMRLITGSYKPAAIFDGFAMIFRMDMLKKAGGFDQRYNFHHIYDRDIALESIKHGYKNIIMDIPSHHLSGLTANRTDWQTLADKEAGTTDFKGDKFYHDDNSRLFKEKWADVLPLYIEEDFSFRTGAQPPWEYKGDAITKL